MILYSNSKKETQEIASKLAVKISGGLPAGKAGVIALEGELGAGKTTFAQAFAKALGIKSKVKSPTFNILKKYGVPRSTLHGLRFLYHIDCYRLKDEKDAEPLGIKEIFKEKNSIVLIEWPERIKKILPKSVIKIHIDHLGPDKRKIKISKSK